MNKIMKFIKNNKKKLIIFFVVIVIIITTAIIILNTNNKQISKKHRVKIFANTSEGIIKEENYNDLYLIIFLLLPKMDILLFQLTLLIQMLKSVM